jgi:hypothetical protein
MLRYPLTFGLFAAGILLSTAPSAWAFSQQNAGSSGDGNSSFTDPNDQITNSLGVRPLDSNEQSMQLGVQQQSTFDPIWWEQSLHGYGPYYQTLRPGKWAPRAEFAMARFAHKLHVDKQRINGVESAVLLFIIVGGLALCVLGAAIYDIGRAFSVW